jgi:hypothetical protein
VTILLALVVAGCHAPRAYFRPAEPTIVETVDRVPGAQFELRDAERRSGELRVWCLRAEEVVDPDDGRRRTTYVDVGLELENHSKEGLELLVEDVRLRDLRADPRRIDTVAPFEPGKTVRVAPDSVSTKYLSFELPSGVRPRQIKSFRLQWVVRESSGRRFSDLTSFVRTRPRYRNHGYPFWGWFVIGYPLWHGHGHH